MSSSSSVNRKFTNVSDCLSYSDARRRFCIRLINYEHNRDVLAGLPHLHCEDLAVLAYYQPEELSCTEETADSDERPQALSVPRHITEADLRAWNLDIQQLFRDAAKMSREVHPAFLAPMRQLLGLSEDMEEGEIPMYVLSCRDARYGASVLFYPGVVDEIARGLQDDLYIIPSSVHELILLRARDVEDTKGLSSMIREVNRNEVSPGEVLSDSLYHYVRADHSIRRISEDVRADCPLKEIPLQGLPG